MMKVLVSLLMCVVLAGCSLAGMAGAPPRLYELRGAVSAPDGVKPRPLQLLVDLPYASAGLDTSRIALVQRDGVMAYYKDVSWTDPAPGMVQTMMLAAFEPVLPSVGRENEGLRADYLLKSDLRQFAVDEAAGVVRVELQAKLVEMPRRSIIAGRGFATEEPLAGSSLEDVVAAYQRAMDHLLAELVSWTLATLPEKSS